MIADFFIWCAGSDRHVLSKCEESVRIKHVGLGTLVVIPALLAFVSMTYALSTIELIKEKPIIHWTGGILWSFIVFAFDRFIVSTHRKQQNNFDEFRNIIFFIRLLFAIILGVVISHPFVMLYFDGSITEAIKTSILFDSNQQDSTYSFAAKKNEEKLDSLENKIDCYRQLLTAEQSGVGIKLPCGISSGIPNIHGSFPRTKEIKIIISDLKNEIGAERDKVRLRNQYLISTRDSNMRSIVENASFDYLKRVLKFESIKAQNPIASTTQFFLIIAFILVDIMPLMFKTFSQFSMYDKILVDDLAILKEINIESRRKTLQKAYDKISSVYAESRQLEKPPNYSEVIDDFNSRYQIARSIIVGVLLGITIAIYFAINNGNEIRQSLLFVTSIIISVATSVIANFVTHIIEYFHSNQNN